MYDREDMIGRKLLSIALTVMIVSLADKKIWERD